MVSHAVNILRLTFLYTPLALGIVIVFRIARFPDLTADGSFALGGAVTASLVVAGHPYLGLPVAALAGTVAGFLTASLYLVFRVNKILSGILVMTSLYALNLRVMGKANIQLIDHPSLISYVERLGLVLDVVVYLLADVSLILVLYLFLKSELGVFFRASGQNTKLVRNLGRSETFYIALGPAIANGLIALDGAVLAQYQGFADVNMGFGSLIMGLAFLFIGRSVVKSDNPFAVLVSSVVGVFVYETVFYLSLVAGARPADLKVVTSLLVLAGLTASRHFGNGSSELENLM